MGRNKDNGTAPPSDALTEKIPDNISNILLKEQCRRNRRDNLPINPVDFVAGKYRTKILLACISQRKLRHNAGKKPQNLAS